MRKAYVWSVAKLNSLYGWGRIGILVSAVWTIGVCVVIVAEFSNDSLGAGDQKRTFTRWVAAAAPWEAGDALVPARGGGAFDDLIPQRPSAKPKAERGPWEDYAKPSGDKPAWTSDPVVTPAPGAKPAWMSGKIVEPRPGELSDAQVFGSVRANWLSIFWVMLAPMVGMWGGAIFLVRATGWVIAGFRRNKVPPGV